METAAVRYARQRTGLARYGDDAVVWLHRNNLFGAAQRRSLGNAGPDTAAAIRRFAGEPGFERVMGSWFAGGNQQVGARFVMRTANARFGHLPPGSIHFEVPLLVDRAGVRRIADVVVRSPDGVVWEFKSVSQLSSYRRQLLHDFTAAIERGRSVRSIGQEFKWIFDGQKAARSGLSRTDVIRRFQGYLLDEYHMWPDDLFMDAVRALDDMIVFQP